MHKMIFGLELECLMPFRQILDMPIGGYGDGIQLSLPGCENWKAEHDNSINGSANLRPLEIINIVPKPANGIIQDLEALSRTLPEISINHTCGAHIHFSIPGIKMHNNLPYNKLASFRKRLHAFMKPEALGMYNRRYAVTLKKSVSGIMKQKSTPAPYSRNLEFNETETEGTEWRGFNLNGCHGWKDIISQYKNAMQLLEDFFMPEYTAPNIKAKFNIPERTQSARLEEINTTIFLKGSGYTPDFIAQAMNCERC